MLNQNTNILLLILFTAIAIIIKSTNAIEIFLYNPEVDNIELVYHETFEKIIYNSEKASLVEFFAHWCGKCQRFAPHWRSVAKLSKPWHKRIIRVAGVDCGQTENTKLCRFHKVAFYPTMYLFEANIKNQTLGQESYYENSEEEFLYDMIKFVQNHSNRPPHWPSLKPYEGTIGNIFKDRPNSKYCIIIFEEDTSYLGRKLILDFESANAILQIHTIHTKANSPLFDQLRINRQLLPAFILLSREKLGGNIKAQNFVTYADNLVRDVVYNTIKLSPEDVMVNPDDPRIFFMEKIITFIQFTSLTLDDSKHDFI